VELITIERKGEILAHHTTETPLSHDGQPVWVVKEKNPEPGPVIWRQGGNVQILDILGVKGGWLITKQRGGYLSGIIWSSGQYYSNLLEDI